MGALVECNWHRPRLHKKRRCVVVTVMFGATIIAA